MLLSLEPPFPSYPSGPYHTLISHEVVHIEGRHLKSRRSQEKKNTQSSGGAANHHVVSLHQEQTSSKPAEHVDDFRPTSPGHSPGVGHSVNN
ncbi:hypothetical protein FEM48_Zijuj08G0113900 [Ziziphus jujuba var. spinosa]|uniref:Uncharacterized protein n=1 Tax=Ziziphus jujuba var. spinosa TaxID=714518 RepID=A0A978UYT4_ZIZJJ|nr:hypothetical protein FEM48_Zijuj08G0113900 [Ziziphus jujuba var. spinosa]